MVRRQPRWHPSDKFEQLKRLAGPEFPENVTLNAGECLKGWLAIEVREGMKVKKIVWRPGGATTAEWLP